MGLQQTDRRGHWSCSNVMLVRFVSVLLLVGVGSTEKQSCRFPSGWLTDNILDSSLPLQCMLNLPQHVGPARQFNMSVCLQAESGDKQGALESAESSGKICKLDVQ